MHGKSPPHAATAMQKTIRENLRRIRPAARSARKPNKV